MQEKLDNGFTGQTFLERLLEVSLNNPKFSFEDVLAETATILTGVRAFNKLIFRHYLFIFFQILFSGHRHIVSSIRICIGNVGNASKISRKSVPRGVSRDARERY